jgi:membrane protein
MRDFLRQLSERIFADEVFGHAAQIAYYFFLALFPMLLFLTTLLGLFAQRGTTLRANLLNYLATVMPVSASALVTATLDEINRGAGGGKLYLSLAASLWAASSGVETLVAALNKAYGVTESRAYWRVKLTSLLLTLALAALVIFALTLIFYGNELGGILQARLGLGATFSWLWHFGQWPLLAACVLLALNLLYYFAPDRRGAGWRWFTAGACVALGLWLLASLLFRLYLSRFDNYNKTYGSLGAVIILLLWFHLMGAAIIIGAEINRLLTEKHGADNPTETEELL